MQKSIITCEGGYACEVRIAPEDKLGNVQECVPQQFAIGQTVIWHITPTGDIITGNILATNVRLITNPDARAIRAYRIDVMGHYYVADEIDLLRYDSGWTSEYIFAWFLSSVAPTGRNVISMDVVEDSDDVPDVFTNFINTINDDSDSIGVGE